MILKIEFAKNKCLSTIWSTEKIPVAWTYPAREQYKNANFLWCYNLTPTLFLANFLVHILTPGCKRYVMQQYLTYLCTDINETGPSVVIFLRVDQFYVLRFLFRVYYNIKILLLRQPLFYLLRVLLFIFLIFSQVMWSHIKYLTFTHFSRAEVH